MSVDVEHALRQATDHLAARPDLLDRVRRRGRHRKVRRRLVLAAGLAAPVAAATTVWSTRAAPAPVASPLLDGPTRGDLAGDRGYLQQILDAWLRRTAEAGIVPDGSPHVVWAGRTPAGPTAVVAQRTRRGHALPVSIGVTAFVEPTRAGPRVSTVTTLPAGDLSGVPQAMLVGPDRDVLVALDGGRPVDYSPDFRYEPDGKIGRQWTAVRFSDGAAVLRVPPQRDRITVALLRPGHRVEDMVFLANELPTSRTQPSSPTMLRLANASDADPRATFGDIFTGPLDPYVDRGGYHTAGLPGLPTVYGVTPDGTDLLVTTIQYDTDPARVLAVLKVRGGSTRVVYAGFSAIGAALPICVRLPDGQGIVVAAVGAELRYRVGPGDWIPAGLNAALVPPATTEVRVRDTVVPVTV